MDDNLILPGGAIVVDNTLMKVRMGRANPFSCQSLLALQTQLMFLTTAEYVGSNALVSPNTVRLEFELNQICTAGANSCKHLP